MISGCWRTGANSALGQRGGLVEDPVGDRELADVVQQRGAAQVAQRPPRPRRARSPGRARSGRRDRSGGRSTATSRRRCRRTRSAIWSSRASSAVSSRSSGSHAADVALGQRAPERRVAAERSERVDQRRVEPAARGACGPRARPRACRPRRGRSRPSGRGRGSARAAGSPRRAARAAGRRRPSARRARGSPRRSRPRGRACSAISAPRSQRACISARVTSPSALIASSRSSRARERAARRDGAQRPHERRQPSRPVDALGGPLGDVVVGAEQRRHLRRVRRAARVLEQQRVEQARACRGVELASLREPHADLAGAHGVPWRLALRDVERIRHRPDHPREWDLRGSDTHARSIAPIARFLGVAREPGVEVDRPDARPRRASARRRATPCRSIARAGRRRRCARRRWRRTTAAPRHRAPSASARRARRVRRPARRSPARPPSRRRRRRRRTASARSGAGRCRPRRRPRRSGAGTRRTAWRGGWCRDAPGLDLGLLGGLGAQVAAVGRRPGRR